MARDAELARLIAEKWKVQEAIDQIVADNATGGSIGDVSIRRVELRELSAHRDRLNVRIRMRQGQLLGQRSPIWGSVIRATRDHDDLDGISSDAMDEGGDTVETPLGPSEPVGPTPGQVVKYFAYVNAPADRNTDPALVVALFTEAVYTGSRGQRFTGDRWTVPDHPLRSVYSLIVPEGYSFGRIIGNPDTFGEDVTSQWPRQSSLLVGGELYDEYITLDPSHWAFGNAGERVFELRT